MCQAQESESKTQDLANRAAVILTIVAIGGGALTLGAWLLFSSQDFAFALERTVTVMVIACPHALGLAVPLVVAVSTAIAATNGLLIRDRAAFERSRNIDAIIFDKTGTLTQGKFGVTDTLAFDPQISKDDILSFAAAVEAHSEHPIAKGIVASAKSRKAVSVVSPGYLRENDLPLEVVERKGIGHPDTICDLLAERISYDLGAYYLETCGRVLHYNVDKALLVGGRSKPRFTGGEILEPAKLYLGDRAISNFNGKDLGLDEVIEGSIHSWLKENLSKNLLPQFHHSPQKISWWISRWLLPFSKT